ncbi:MAG: hypothetical protein M1820_000209 [Bogoriella megaspora]|nr:MAG: hypothetical protein M1820_000209 [Bogoriella megaspora]
MDGDDLAEDQALRDFLGTTSFGKQAKDANVAARIDQSKRKPVTDAALGADQKGFLQRFGESAGSEGSDVTKEQSDNEDDSDSDDDEDEFPVSHELLVKTHERAVTSVTLDPSGARMITGSQDCTVKLHDFSSWTPTTVRAFKSVDPSASKTSTKDENHTIHQVLFNPLYPSSVLVINAQTQARVMSRDGEIESTTKKGDMYLRDMKNTKGHVSEITGGAWHPTDYNQFVTAGTDSTLRIWDINNYLREQKSVIVHKSKAMGSAGRTRMTAVVWGSPTQGGPNVLVAAALDGSLVMYSGEGPHHRPAAEIRDAHTPETWTGGIDISADGRLIVTRGGDDTIKLWDTRKFKQPVNTVSHKSTSSIHPTTNIRFSPTSTNIITGSEDGSLHILNPATLKPELTTPVTPGSPVITVLWHAKLNQIITGSANASTHILYNPNLSTGGAKLVMSKAAKVRHIDDDPNNIMDLSAGIDGDNITSDLRSLRGPRKPNTGLTVSGKSRDPRRPHQPAKTPFGDKNKDPKWIEQNIQLAGLMNEDPQKELLKMQDKIKDDPWFTKAWKETQPKTEYTERSDGEEEDEEPARKKQRGLL